MRRVACLAVGLLAACGSSPPVEYYALPTGDVVQPTAEDGGRLVVVGPVRLPAYLSRPYVAWRDGASRVAYEDDHRWGASLEAEVLRATTEHLSRELGSLAVVAHPARATGSGAIQVTLDVDRLDVTPRGESSLRARFVVRGTESDKVLASGVADVRAQMDGRDAEAAVHAYAELIRRMAAEVAGRIRSL